jgi:hypothetical protein
VTDGAASIQLLSDAGGIGIKSTASLANAIYLHANGGISETIKLHADQGTGAASIELTSDAGGIGINTTAAGKTLDINTAILDLDATEASNITMTTNAGSTTSLTIEATNSHGSYDSDIVIDADGQVHINANDTTSSYAGAGIQIGTNLADVDVAIGNAAGSVRIGNFLAVAGNQTIAGNLTVSGTFTATTTSEAAAVSSGTPLYTLTNTTHENNDLDGSSDTSDGRQTRMVFKGEKADGTVHELSTIVVGHEGTGNDLKGQMQFFVNAGSDSDGALTNVMNIIDTGRVGIGTTSPDSILHTKGTGSQVVKVESTDNNSSLIISSDTDEGQISGLYFDAGSATKGSIIYNHNTTATDQNMRFLTGDNSVTAMTIEGDGKVGIGVTSPLAMLHVKPTGAISTDVTTFSGDAIVIDSGSSSAGDGYVGGAIAWTKLAAQNGERAGAIAAIQTGADVDQCGLAFYSHSGSVDDGVISQAMTINHDQFVGIGTASPGYPLEVVGGGDGAYVALFDNSGTGSTAHGISISAGDADHADSDTHYIQFLEQDSGVVGELDSDGGSLALSDTSDKRLKKNIRDTKTKGLEIINGTRMRDFEWKKNELAFKCGIIAQELQEVFPKAVKEGDDEDKTLRIRKTDFIYVLVKAVQELSAKVTALENA